MEKEDIVVTKENPLVLNGGGTFRYGTITIKNGGAVRIENADGGVTIRADRIVKEDE